MPFSGFQDLDPAFAAALQQYIAANPGLSIYSGYRTPKQQRKLWLASDRSGHMVAKNSYHTARQAADLRYNDQPIKSLPAAEQQRLHENAARYGLKFPMSWEPWHVELSSTRGGGMAGGGSPTTAMPTTGAMAFTGTAQPQPQPQQTAEASTLSDILKSAIKPKAKAKETGDRTGELVSGPEADAVPPPLELASAAPALQPQTQAALQLSPLASLFQLPTIGQGNLAERQRQLAEAQQRGIA